MNVRSATLQCMITVLTLAMADVACGQEGPYSLGLSQTVGYKYNVFQVTSGEPRTDDWVASTGILVEVNQVVDIYSLSLAASAQSNTYQDTKVLNNPTYNLSLDLASNAERLSTHLRVTANQGLGDYATPNVEQITEKNIQNTEEVGLGFRYASTPRVGIGGGLAYQWNTFSAAAFQSQESSQGAAFLDIGYRVTPVLQVGVGPRFTKGTSPKYAPGAIEGTYIADDFDGRYLDVLAAWEFAADSGLRGGLSATRVTHTVATQLDYSGLTGFITWWRQIGGKLGFNVSLSQSTGLGALSGSSAFGSPVATDAPGSSSGGTASTSKGGGSPASTSGPSLGIGGTGAGATGSAGASDSALASSVNNNQLNRTVTLGASYLLGSKTDITAGLVVNNGYFSNASGVPGSVRTTSLAVGINYAPVPALSLACNVNFSRQNASQSAISSGQAHSYNASTASCAVQYTLQ